MEGHRRMISSATQTIALLAFIYLIYTQSFGFDPIKLYSGTRNLLKNTTVEEVGALEDKLQRVFESLIGNGDLEKLQKTGFACDSTIDSLVCVASDPVKVDIEKMEIYMPTNDTDILEKEEGKIIQVRPYAWPQLEVLENVTPIKFLHEPPQTPTRYCNYNHTVPALVFSTGGFAGNLFHEFNEIIIPLYITSRLFESRVQFILVDYNPSFLKKYNRIFSSLSSYNVLNSTTNTSVHCFPGAVVGLKFHGYLAINSSGNSMNYSRVSRGNSSRNAMNSYGVSKDNSSGNSITEFMQFLRRTYSLKTMNVSSMDSKAPVLLLVSRRKTRSFLNQDELVDMMEDLGFEVMVVRNAKKMSNLDTFAKLVSTCSVLVGAHGAGITNQVFLPTGAVVVQVVPLGLEWGAAAYFGEPAVQMGLHYLEYKVEPEESSLIDMYAHEDPVISDPMSVFAKGYYVGRELYLNKQNVTINVNRFKGTLIEVLKLLKRTIPLST